MSAYPPGLSGTLWPVHPKPLLDELLSCWLVRIARAFGTTVDRFCQQAWPEPVWSGDIDINAGARVLRVLAAKTATPHERISEMTLSSYAQRLSAPAPTLFDEASGGRRLRFCATCLKDDAIPYYRREWRLSFITVCALHRAPLRRNCAQCGRAVDLQQVPLEAESLAVCFSCAGKIFSPTDATPVSDLGGRTIEMQCRLCRLLI